MNPYLNLLALFLLGIILLAGNLMVSVLWKNMADRHGDPRVVAFAQKVITLSDFGFTLTGTLVVGGASAAVMLLNDLDFSTLWVQSASGVFAAHLLLWLLLQVPLQAKQSRLARVFASGGTVPDEYWKSCRQWNRIRVVQILLVLSFVGIVLFKPV